MLTLQHVSKHFGNLGAVGDVLLTVPKGKLIGLIGPNGSGKSTLLSLIAGELRSDSGKVVFDDQEVTGASPDRLFRLGLVRSYQDPSLFTRMTTLDNGLLPMQDQLGEQLRRAPWHRLWSAQETEHGHSTVEMLERLQLRHQTGTQASDLSGGQMKLLELGRTLMGKPLLLLPLRVENLRAGYGKLVVLHDVSLQIDEGQFVAILGSNGSGKSTLLKSIFGITTIFDGDIQLHQKSLIGQPTEMIGTHGIAYVSQRETEQQKNF